MTSYNNLEDLLQFNTIVTHDVVVTYTESLSVRAFKVSFMSQGLGHWGPALTKITGQCLSGVTPFSPSG